MNGRARLREKRADMLNDVVGDGETTMCAMADTRKCQRSAEPNTDVSSICEYAVQVDRFRSADSDWDDVRTRIESKQSNSTADSVEPS